MRLPAGSNADAVIKIITTYLYWTGLIGCGWLWHRQVSGGYEKQEQIDDGMSGYQMGGSRRIRRIANIIPLFFPNLQKCDDSGHRCGAQDLYWSPTGMPN
ncbi:unnamed protein product [Clavelina lepadiformis]|uniref:Uncharacterized protein n=1 Tax=Clavelina lepadiformis TaxID=159417 RepID=A0ABP0FWV6_CLALP